MTHRMTRADEYRVKAGDLAALAKAEPDPFGKAEYERLCQAYLRLAEQADRNSRYVIDRKPPDETQAEPQQQQQSQSKSKRDEE